MKTAKTDKRLFQRFSARFPAKIKDSRDDFGTRVFLRDASAQGFKLTTREKMLINDNVTLEVKMPDGNDPLRLSGQVQWIKTKEPDMLWDIGFKFHKVNLMNVHRLFKFIDAE